MAQQGVKFARVHGRIVPLRTGGGGGGKKPSAASAARHYASGMASTSKYLYHKNAANKSEFRLLGAGAMAGVGGLMMGKLRGNPLSKVGHMGAGLLAGGAVMGAMGLASNIMHHVKARGAKVAAQRSAKLFKRAGGQVNRTSA
jgi:hypothetical protein